MILFTGRAGGRWYLTLRKLVEAWKRGETTVLFTPDHVWFTTRKEVE